MKTVFLTGGTGVVGSALAPLFLNEPDTELWLLIRARDDAELATRVDSLFSYWGADLRSGTARQRLRALRGDVSEDRLGLTTAGYETLAGRVTHIVHSAASVKMNMSEEEARRSSIVPTEAILALANRARVSGTLRKLDYVSTLGVAGRMSGLVPEAPLAGDQGFHNTYESSKAEAERLVLAAIADGLPVTIHRPSMVVGDSRTGKAIRPQVFQFLAGFLTGGQTAGFVPRLTGVQLDTIPSDFVAAAIHWSSGASGSVGRILHLCTGPERAIGLMPLMEMAREVHGAKGERLPALKPLPLPVFRALMRIARGLSGEDGRRRLANLALFLDYAEDRQTFDNTGTARLLAGVGLPVPDPASYLPRILGLGIDAARRKREAANPSN
jgi:nucleoside-diphosphate-sugar epimerase